MESFLEFFENRYLSENNHLDNAPYEVVDKKTGDVIWRGPYSKRKYAKRLKDKKDLEYGAIRYIFRPAKDTILEYRHKDSFGGIKQSLHANNKKGGNITRDPLTRKIPWTKGPYEKIRSAGEILIGDDLLKELGSMGGIEFKDGKEIKRKNSNQILKLFTNLHGQQCGKIVEIKK